MYSIKFSDSKEGVINLKSFYTRVTHEFIKYITENYNCNVCNADGNLLNEWENFGNPRYIYIHDTEPYVYFSHYIVTVEEDIKLSNEEMLMILEAKGLSLKH